MKFLKKREPIKLLRSSEKLEAAGFDPIQELINLHDSIEEELRHLCYNELGERREKYSKMAYAALVAQQQSISSQLLRYDYARVSETAAPAEVAAPTINITLTGYEP